MSRHHTKGGIQGRIAVLASCFLAGGLVFAQEVRSQEFQDVQSGDRIRITAPFLSDAPISGSFQGVSDRALRFVVGREGYELRVPLHEIARMEISAGLEARRRGVIRGMGWGVLIGGIPAAITLGGGRCFFDDTDGLPDPCSGALIALASGFWGGSIAVGGIVGGRLLREEWWTVGLPDEWGTERLPEVLGLGGGRHPTTIASSITAGGPFGIQVRIPLP